MNITCSYCRATNAEDDHRCTRCGRRLHLTPPQAIAAAYGVSNAATARALRPEPAPQPTTLPSTTPEQEERPQIRRPAYQRSLFNPREVPQIVPFESIAPKPLERARPRTERAKPRARRPIPGQQTLEFSAPPPQSVETAVEAVIYCDAPVAVPAHRVMAAAVDLSLIAIALGIFLAILQLALGYFHLLNGPVVLNKSTVTMFVLIAVVFGLLYKVLWCLADGDSPGMRAAHLRLVNFDGRRPDREQRLYRIAFGCLSFVAAGLGVMWAMVDEEKLTWHDHISKTFPTPD